MDNINKKKYNKNVYLGVNIIYINSIMVQLTETFVFNYRNIERMCQQYFQGVQCGMANAMLC